MSSQDIWLHLFVLTRQTDVGKSFPQNTACRPKKKIKRRKSNQKSNKQKTPPPQKSNAVNTKCQTKAFQLSSWLLGVSSCLVAGREPHHIPAGSTQSLLITFLYFPPKNSSSALICHSFGSINPKSKIQQQRHLNQCTSQYHPHQGRENSAMCLYCLQC